MSPDVADSDETSENRLFRLPETGIYDGEPPNEEAGFWFAEPPERRNDMSEDCMVAMIVSVHYIS